MFKNIFTKKSKVSTMVQRYTAFTLAEVLITLGIIGIIAALTIPNLIKNTNDKELKSAWKKNFSLLNQAYLNVLQDYGGSVKGYTSLGFSQKAFAKYLKPIKSCITAKTNECWSNEDPTATGTTQTKLLGGGSIAPNWGPLGRGLTLADGTFVLFRDDSSECDITASAWGMGSFLTCSQIWVDVNGIKKPNTIGKDIYLIFQMENRLIPAGASGTAINPQSTCTDAKNAPETNAYPRQNTYNTGYGCAALYLYE